MTEFEVKTDLFRNFSQDEQMIMISKKIYLDDIDPYFIMKTKPLSLETLFEKYSILRKKNHPDKGGEKDNFIKINKALQTMKKIRNINLNDKEFFQLRDSYFENLKQEKQDDVNLNFYDNGGNFSVNKFNEYFEKFKFENENDGYGNVMDKSSSAREDINIKQINFKHFHNNFIKENSKKDKKIQLYKSPDACNNLDNNYSGIVSNVKSDYSSNQYSDYIRAFSESEIDYSQNIEERDLENYKKKREDPKSLLLSDEEKLILEKEKKKQDKKEYNHLEEVKQYDIRAASYDKKLKKLLK